MLWGSRSPNFNYPWGPFLFSKTISNRMWLHHFTLPSSQSLPCSTLSSWQPLIIIAIVTSVYAQVYKHGVLSLFLLKSFSFFVYIIPLLSHDIHFIWRWKILVFVHLLLLCNGLFPSWNANFLPYLVLYLCKLKKLPINTYGFFHLPFYFHSLMLLWFKKEYPEEPTETADLSSTNCGLTAREPAWDQPRPSAGVWRLYSLDCLWGS